MDYEQKHKEDLEAAKGWLAIAKENNNTIAIQILEKFFPELRKSEDEQHRRWILEYLYDGLRKSDEQFKDQFKSAIAWLEKQDEQKPFDEYESKFKVDDWITNGEYTWKVTDIKPLDYILQSPNGDVVDDTISHVDEEFHLWTIQDAKDGDVLAYVTDEEDLWIMIYWSLYESYEGHVHYHALLVNDNFSDKGTCCICIDDLKPATEEQRDLLFQKMKEAGYEWDVKKKELRTIELSCYHNDGLYYAIDILEKTLGKVEGYQSDDGIMEHQTAIETVKALYHKKPAEWSEEDRKHIDNIISLLNQAKERFVRESGQFPSWITEILWLKSIKDRVQPQQQEWSEEGEKMLEDTISCLSAYQSPDISKGLCYQEQIDWLKSIKPNHWKPSEGQLEALKYVVDYFGELTEHFVEYEEIKSLYNDLKSL